MFFCGKAHEVFIPDLCPIHEGAPTLGSLGGWNWSEREHQGITFIVTPEEVVAWRKRALMLIEAGKNAPPYPEVQCDDVEVFAR